MLRVQRIAAGEFLCWAMIGLLLGFAGHWWKSNADPYPDILDKDSPMLNIALTEHTVADRKRLEQIIDECRRSGYAAVEDELAFGVVAVAVPVVDNAGRVVAALNSSGHSKKMKKAQLVRDRLPMLRQVSRQISQELALVPGLSLSAQS